MTMFFIHDVSLKDHQFKSRSNFLFWNPYDEERNPMKDSKPHWIQEALNWVLNPKK